MFSDEKKESRPNKKKVDFADYFFPRLMGPYLGTLWWQVLFCWFSIIVVFFWFLGKNIHGKRERERRAKLQMANLKKNKCKKTTKNSKENKIHDAKEEKRNEKKWYPKEKRLKIQSNPRSYNDARLDDGLLLRRDGQS